MIKNNRSYWSMLQTHNVTVSVKPMRAKSRLVFRVVHVVDVGPKVRPKVTLDCIAYGGPGCMESVYDVDFDVPDWIEGLDLIYMKTDKAKRLLPYQRIEHLYESAQIEEIVTDVVRPGDLIVMQKDAEKRDGRSNAYAMATSRAKLRVYRLVKSKAKKKQDQSNQNAL